jgi:hypothetical protein
MPTSKAREFGHISTLHVMEVGDVPGHNIAVVEQVGLLSDDAGRIATASAKFTIDLINGSGKFQGYELVTYEDGSTWYKFEGTVTAHPDGSGRSEGTSEIIKGTGQWEGIQGSGSWTSRTFPGAVIQYLTDSTSTYTLPSK